MAQRRMFSLKIVSSDAFLDLPTSSRELYFQLGMYADDDGFVNPKKIVRMVGASDDDIKLLIAKRFVLPFENGVVVIKHWLINNLIRKDFYQETAYLEEKKSLVIKENKAYSDRKQIVNNLDTQVRLGKVSLDKDSKESEDTPAQKAKKFFDDTREQARILEELGNKGVTLDVASIEIKKFISYWTEPNKSGTKQRWELEKTFELGRRLATWFRNYQGFNAVKKSNVIQI